MTFAIGEHTFDHVTYDPVGDVLYVRSGESRPAADVYGTPEGHAVRFDQNGSVIGITIVNARWLVERDGRITITVPTRIEASAKDLNSLLVAGGNT